MQRTPPTQANRASGLQTQATGLLRHHRTLLDLGSDVATAARLATAMHMADAAPAAQNPRDQAARLRDLVAAMSAEGAR